MSWRLAASLKTLRDQVNEVYPNRDKSSDGSIGDMSHSTRKSDHNPNAAGVVTAIDIDRDLNDGHDVRELVTLLQGRGDPRIKYIIFERQITVPGDLSKWKPYNGANAHEHHAHISVSGEPALYDDGRPFGGINGSTGSSTAQPVEVPRDLKTGDKGADVRALQVKLGVTVDGDFGRGTEKAVKEVQHKAGLQVDGIVGSRTRDVIGL